jgi:outer membrane protein assembly factor BamA
VLFGIGNSHWYIGPRYTYFDAQTRFDLPVPSGIANFERDQRIAKGGVVIDYDSRDNIFYPTRGIYAEFEGDLARLP